MTAFQMASLIAKNNVGEQEAIEGYYLLLDEASKNNLSGEFIRDIKEIISDELNHTEKLNGWMVKLSGVKPNET